MQGNEKYVEFYIILNIYLFDLIYHKRNYYQVNFFVIWTRNVCVGRPSKGEKQPVSIYERTEEVVILCQI